MSSVSVKVSFESEKSKNSYASFMNVDIGTYKEGEGSFVLAFCIEKDQPNSVRIRLVVVHQRI